MKLKSPASMQSAQQATTAFQQCHIVCSDACSCAPAASLNPTYTYGAQKEGSMSPPPAPSISALQVSTTRWISCAPGAMYHPPGQCRAGGSLSEILWVAKQAAYVGLRYIPGTMSGLAPCASYCRQAEEAADCPQPQSHSWRAGCLPARMPLPADCHPCQAREQQRRRRASGQQEHEEDFQQQGAQPDRSADVRPAAHARGGLAGALNGGR